MNNVNKNVTLSLENIKFEIYDLLFGKLIQKGFRPPEGLRNWKTVKISISSSKYDKYKQIEINGTFPDGQTKLEYTVNQILDELNKREPHKIKSCFKTNEINKYLLCKELEDKGFIVEEYVQDNNEFCLIIYCSDPELSETIYYRIGDILIPNWLLFSICEASKDSKNTINIQIFYDE